MNKRIFDLYRNSSKAFKVLLPLFSLLFAKSIFISPFSLAAGAFGVVLGIVLWAAVFVLCLSAVYFVGKISWGYKKTKVKKVKLLLYMLPSLVLSTFLLLVFFPGIMSWDSMYIWECTVGNDFSNLHPVTYVLFVDVLNSIVASPWIVIAVQFIYSAFVFAYVGYVFEGFGLNKRLCWAIVLVLSFYPVNAYQNITMLKDVPYMMSLVLLSVILLKTLAENKFSLKTAASITVVSLAAMFSRHNGVFSVPFALGITAIFFLIRKNKNFAVKTAAVLIASVVLFFGSNAAIKAALGNRYWQRSSSPDLLMTPSAQLSYTIDKNWNLLSPDLQEEAAMYLDIGYIKHQKEEIPNWHFNNRYLETLNMDIILKDKPGFIDFYLKTLKNYPKDMIVEYMQITGILWATPNYGYTLVRNHGIPKSYIDIGLKSDYIFPKIAEFLDGLPHIYFLARPALWLMLSLLLLFAIKKGRRLMGFIIISPMIANAAGFIFGSPAQNVRYLYCNFSCFVILLVFAFMAAAAGQKKENEEAPAETALSE